ncbi:MAG: DUF5658 family protein [Chloroflexota bacterium]
MIAKRSLRAADKALVIALYLVLQGLDVLTTFVGLRRGAYEANLLPGWLIQHYGEASMYLFKVLLVLGVLFVVVCLQRPFPRVWLAVRVVNVMMVLVLAVNLMTIA